MVKDIITEYSKKVKEAKQQVITSFENEVQKGWTKINNAAVTDDQVAQLKKKYLDFLKKNQGNNQLRKEILELLTQRKRYFQLTRDAFVRDVHLSSYIDKDVLASEFDADTKDYITIPSSPIAKSLFSHQKFRYYLIPAISILLTFAVYFAIMFVGGFGAN